VRGNAPSPNHQPPSPPASKQADTQTGLSSFLSPTYLRPSRLSFHQTADPGLFYIPNHPARHPLSNAMPPSAPKTKSASSTLSPNWPHYASIATICVTVLGALMRYFVIGES
jgi:hypothetical protein